MTKATWIRGLALGTLLFSPGLASADGPAWELRDTTDGLSIYNRRHPGSPIQEVKAEGTVDAPPAAVWAVLRDVADYPKTMPYTKTTSVLGQEQGGKILYYYTALDLPVISDRDYTLRVVVDHVPTDGSGIYQLSWTAANTYPRAPPPLRHYVRVSDVSGFWRLEPVAGGRATRVVYFVHTDPASALPNFIINKANSDAVPKVVDALREWAKKPPYVSAK